MCVFGVYVLFPLSKHRVRRLVCWLRVDCKHSITHIEMVTVKRATVKTVVQIRPRL